MLVGPSFAVFNKSMDTIITIVIIAAAIAFKVIGRKLSSAAGDEVFPTITADPDMLDGPELQEYLEPVEELVRRPEPMVVNEPVFEEVAKPAPAVRHSVRKPSPKILKEEAPLKKEKIDPKKLIVYSEIMKPKYLE